jgi:ribonuclease-3
MDNKFRSNPYNPLNILISEDDILNILNDHNIQDYKITNLSLFQQAFIHTSYCNEYEEYDNNDKSIELFDKSYETLEFLGDSLLGSSVTRYLYNRYVNLHNKEEGFLTQIKIRLICGEQLAFLSEKINFNKFMIISKNVENNSGRDNCHILEDIYEAFLGALFLDSTDISLVDTFIITCIERYVDISDLILNDNNYKGLLLKYFQHNFLTHPIYKTDKSEENNIFISNVYRFTENNQEELCGSGEGKTKKKAEQNASRNILIHYRVMSE